MVVVRQATELAVAPREVVRAPVLARVQSLISLTKPRIIELLLITTIPTMIVAERAIPPIGLMAATVTGGMFAAGGANALNMYVDRDIDRLMVRTQHRPLVTGALSARTALVFALGLEVIAFVELAALVNLLSALLAAAATTFYVGVYTLWLKRTSRHNIVIGGAAGAVPVLIGWSSVTGRLGWTPLVLFALIFTWTPPHFWALAMKYRADYRAAGVPMLPAVTTASLTARWILGYTFLMVGVSLAFSAVAGMGLIYSGSAIALGAVFILLSVRMCRDPSPSASMRLFGYSITYLSVLFVAIAVDQLIRIRW